MGAGAAGEAQDWTPALDPGLFYDREVVPPIGAIEEAKEDEPGELALLLGACGGAAPASTVAGQGRPLRRIAATVGAIVGAAPAAAFTASTDAQHAAFGLAVEGLFERAAPVDTAEEVEVFEGVAVGWVAEEPVEGPALVPAIEAAPVAAAEAGQPPAQGAPVALVELRRSGRKRKAPTRLGDDDDEGVE